MSHNIPHSEETKKKIGLSSKGRVAWNRGLKGAQIAWNKGRKTRITYIHTSEWKEKMSSIMKEKGFLKGSVPWNKGLHIKGHKHTSEAKQKISESKLKLYTDKTKHPSYQHGISYSEDYQRIHAWLKENYGKADKCDNIKCLRKSKTFDYAKLTNKDYKPDRNNYIMLCRICHTKMNKKTKNFSVLLTNNQ